ncbi:MAG TPA: hypothetical protein VK497_02920 [Candidatus Saccharimonadales bacterium]|nr:hypothetical protein [Candidatus Saccharimonadales bacterium]
MSTAPFDTQPSLTPEKEQGFNGERVSVTMLNTSFGDALQDSETAERILPAKEDHLALVGFSEVTPGVRSHVVEVIEKQGYKAVVPSGESEDIDIIWAVSPGLEVRHTVAHRFDGRIESRPGKRQKRDAGTLVVEAVTPDGRVLRLSSERFAPPLRGPKARRVHMIGMSAVLDGLTNANDGTVDIDISGGDHNKANGPTESDKAMWRDKGYTPIVADGETTYNVQVAGKMARAAGKALQILGRFPTMEFDKMYARPGDGRELVRFDPNDDDATLTLNQVGYTIAEVIWVGGTDHAAISTTISFPSK